MSTRCQVKWASLMAQMIKNLPAVRATWVQSLGPEDPMEEGMATHSSILARRIPTDRGAWWAAVHGVPKNRTRLTKHSTQNPSPGGSVDQLKFCQHPHA